MSGGVRHKQKSVTIIHSATTETVRLPEDSNGVIYFVLFSIHSHGLDISLNRRH